MRNITAENTFRGPKSFYESEFRFSDSNLGTKVQFLGKETITVGNIELDFSLNYSGGFVM